MFERTYTLKQYRILLWDGRQTAIRDCTCCPSHYLTLPNDIQNTPHRQLKNVDYQIYYSKNFVVTCYIRWVYNL